MTMQSGDITGFRFSTAHFGERDRLPIFREQIGRMIVKLDPEPLDDGAEHVRHHAHLHQSGTDAEE